jgi:formylmethanofuran dehydrogenase subunit E
MNQPESDITVFGRPVQEALDRIENFHGWKAPGVVLGLFMVELAKEAIGAGVEADAIVETRHCLPDAVQIFTPCTIGNGWLKVLDWDKYALSLYDRREFSGVRVWLDLEKALRHPEIHGWYMRTIPKKDLPLEKLLHKIVGANRSILSSRAVRVTRHNTRQKKGGIAICPGCAEAYPTLQGARCEACEGRGYYEILDCRL